MKNLFENPFYILGVSAQSSNHDIIMAAEEKSLFLDADICANAKKILTNPRQRLSAEISWLPGTDASAVNGILEQIQNDRNTLVKNISEYNPIDQCNIICTIIEHHIDSISKSGVQQWIYFVASQYDEIDVNDIQYFINTDREQASIPVIQSTQDVEHELELMKRHYVKVCTKLIFETAEPATSITDTIELSLKNKECVLSIIEDIAGNYQLEYQRHLSAYEVKINTFIENIISLADQSKKASPQLTQHINNMINLATEWDKLAQPLQLIKQSCGIDEDNSYALAQRMRDLSFHLGQEYQLFNESKLITEAMSSIFSELPQFSEVLENDLTQLDDIISSRNRSIQEEEDWKRSICLDIEFGKIFVDKLKITPETFTFNSTTFRLKDITRIRWGSYVHYTNGIKDHTSYGVWVGTADKMVKIECSLKLEYDSTSSERFSTVVNKLWRAVGTRLMIDVLSRISRNQKVSFGRKGITLDREGIVLTKHKLLWGGEPYHCKWRNFGYHGYSGSLHFTTKLDDKVKGELSYRDDDNTHVLESVLDYINKDDNYKKILNGEFA